VHLLHENRPAGRKRARIGEPFVKTSCILIKLFIARHAPGLTFIFQPRDIMAPMISRSHKSQKRNNGRRRGSNNISAGWAHGALRDGEPSEELRPARMPLARQKGQRTSKPRAYTKASSPRHRSEDWPKIRTRSPAPIRKGGSLLSIGQGCGMQRAVG